MTEAIATLAGHSFPLGAICQADGVNFSVYSKNATAVELLLFDQVASAQPAQTISLDLAKHRTYYYWHAGLLRPG